MCNELGERPAPAGSRRDRHQVFPKNNRHTPVMVYDDLMIRNNTVSYYNTNRSRPVTVLCIHTGIGTEVDRRRSTGMICPNRTLNSVRIIVSFFRMASSPVTISHQLILDIYILYNYTCHLGDTLQIRTYLIIRTH